MHGQLVIAACAPQRLIAASFVARLGAEKREERRRERERERERELERDRERASKHEYAHRGRFLTFRHFVRSLVAGTSAGPTGKFECVEYFVTPPCGCIHVHIEKSGVAFREAFVGGPLGHTHPRRVGRHESRVWVFHRLLDHILRTTQYAADALRRSYHSGEASCDMCFRAELGSVLKFAPSSH